MLFGENTALGYYPLGQLLHFIKHQTLISDHLVGSNSQLSCQVYQVSVDLLSGVIFVRMSFVELTATGQRFGSVRGRVAKLC